MPRNNQRGRNNNPSGRNQYSSDWMDTVRERPMASAAAAAAAVGAGVFLWSKRNQISDQISSLSDQISGWAGDMRSEGTGQEMAMSDGSSGSSAVQSSGSRSGGSTAKARRTSGRAMPQSTTM
jgi:hypothetical protein